MVYAERTHLLDSSSIATDTCSSTSTTIRLCNVHDASPHSHKKRKQQASGKSWLQQAVMSLDPDGIRFAARMSIILSLCTLFVLIQFNNMNFPMGFWVYVTVLNVSWFPRLDSASVMEKTIQRWLGTMLGAIVGLTCGCLSEMLFPKQPYHNIFLFVSTAVVVLVALTFAGIFRIEGGKKRLIEQYSYATCLFCLTLGVALMLFAGVTENSYKAGLFCVMNVSIGCCLGAAGSVLLWPRPTLKVLHQKTAQQVILAGQASEAVLHTAVDAFSGRRAVPLLSQQLLQSRMVGQAKSLRQLLSNQSNKADLALEKYEEAIGGWMQSKALFPLLRYDPFSVFGRKLSCSKQTTQELEQEENEQDTDIATILARALRIQTTVIVLDGMIRYDAVYEFDEEQLQLFATTGTLIRQLLTLPLVPPSLTALTLQGLFGQLEALRLNTRRAAASFLDDPHHHNDKEEDEAALLAFQSRLLRGTPSARMDDNKGRGLPLYTTCSIRSNRLQFLQLVEHLVLRALRLYHALADT